MTDDELGQIDERFPDLLRDGGYVALAAMIDGARVGYVMATKMTDGWYLQKIEVEPPQRRKRIGSALLAELFKHTGKTACLLSVDPDNRGAIDFYIRAGFRFKGSGRPRMMIRD